MDCLLLLEFPTIVFNKSHLMLQFRWVLFFKC